MLKLISDYLKTLIPALKSGFQENRDGIYIDFDQLVKGNSVNESFGLYDINNELKAYIYQKETVAKGVNYLDKQSELSEALQKALTSQKVNLQNSDFKVEINYIKIDDIQFASSEQEIVYLANITINYNSYKI